MFKHYLKITFRTLWKYKSQSVISIIGLSVGLVCFVLSTMWIRYELTYDAFRLNADRIYRVRVPDIWTGKGLYSVTPYPLANYLKETFPEIEAAGNLQDFECDIKANGQTIKVNCMRADTSFFHIFSVPILIGNKSVLRNESKEVAVTEDLAKRLFGEENPLGKQIKFFGEEYSVEAVIPTNRNTHTHIPYDFLCAVNQRSSFGASDSKTYILLKEGVDKEQFMDKLHHLKIEKDAVVLSEMVATPLTALHYTQPDEGRNIKFNHVILFAVAGGLVIICSLFNYLTLFISRIRMRGKELALRKVNGASDLSFLVLLSMELMVTLCFAVLLGFILIEWVMPEFLELSSIRENKTSIYLEMIGYAFLVMLFSLLVSLIPIEYFRKKTLQLSLQGGMQVKSRNLFRRGSIILQLIISIGFIFCTSILFKQIHYLNHTDLGIARENIYTLEGAANLSSAVVRELKQLPTIEEALFVQTSLLPKRSDYMYHLNEWEGKHPDAPRVNLHVLKVDDDFIRFYNLTLSEGELFDENKNVAHPVIINETAARKFGWNKPLGKKYKSPGGEETTVIGVIKDYYVESPTIPAQAIAFYKVQEEDFKYNSGNIIYKCKEGKAKECKDQMDEIMKRKFPDLNVFTSSMEELYKEYMKSEQSLLLLLGFVSIVCILVSVFGIYSLSSLSAEEKRKEIAIRKVNGATVKSILHLFLREYLWLLLMGAFIAFPIGYLIMHAWIQNYMKQTAINSWIYLSIFFVAGFVIAMSVISCVWHAAKQNPAEVIKSE